MKKVNLPTTPAHKGSRQHRAGEALLDAAFCRMLLGILVLRNGGKTLTFSQADLDSITGLFVLEGIDANGDFLVTIGYPEGMPTS